MTQPAQDTLPVQDATALNEALNKLQAEGGADTLTETLVVGLNELEDTVQDAFTNVLRAVKGRIPEGFAPVAEEAVAMQITERVKLAVEGQLRNAAQVRTSA